jgi:Flp pilus assembly protein TadD
MAENIAQLHQKAAAAFQSGNKGAAVDILEKVLQDHPNNPWIVGELGGVLIELNRKGVGAALLTLACSLQKERGIEDWRHWSTLGSTLESLEQRDLARQAFDEAVRVDPTQADIWDQIAGTYVNDGTPDLCISAARKALELNPNDVIAKKHLALGLLEAGEWSEAWPLMEARKLIRDYQRPIYNLPQWNGQKVDTLIVHGEQGIGDEIMYLSLIARIRDRARRIILEVTPRLVALMRRSFSDLGCEVYGSMDEVAANGGMTAEEIKGTHAADLPQTVQLDGLHIGGAEPVARPSIISNASLPYVLGLGRSQVRSPGYLLPDATRVNYWSEKLRAEAKGRPVIGLAWEGGVRKTHKKVRNAPYEAWAPFVADQRFYWVSVQYTHGEIENKSMPGVVHYQQAIDDLDEQAALISALDLLVSVPQTAVHIAGALAVPTIAVVSSKPRWDFCAPDDAMPWWDSVTMIKQQGSEWDDVFARLRVALDRRFPEPKRVVHSVEAAE